MFELRLPTGSTIKFKALDDHTIDFIKSQYPDQEILRLESINVSGSVSANSNSDVEVYDFTVNSESGWFSGLVGNTSGKFRNAKNSAPEPGIYRLVLCETKQSIVEYGICGTAVDALRKPGGNFEDAFGSALAFSLVTHPNSLYSYGFIVVNNKLFVPIHFDAQSDRFMEIRPPADLIRSGHTFGCVSGHIHSLASVLPFESILGLLSQSPLKYVESVIFTGHGWSGTIAHCAAILFRKILEECKANKTVKAVSFNGPLCGSLDLVQQVLTGQLANHVTIGSCGMEVRLILDMQLLSPLMRDHETFHQSFYTDIRSAMKRVLNKESTDNINDVVIYNAEQCLANAVSSSADLYNMTFKPIGHYIAKPTNDFTTIFSRTDTEEIQNIIQSMSLYHHDDGIDHHPIPFHIKQAPAGRVIKQQSSPGTTLKPILTSLKAHWTKYRLTLQLDGEYLDCIQGRLISHEIVIEKAIPSELPFIFIKGGLIITPASTMTTIVSTCKQLTIELVHTDIESIGEIYVITDFGESNTIEYSEKDIVRGEEAAPSKSLHPTMNTELLSAAILRVAIYCKRLGGLEVLQENTELLTLWTLLLALEEELCPSSNSGVGLRTYVTKYLRSEIDIISMKTQCISILEIISSKTVEEFQFKENVLAWGGRKLTGIIGKVGGGLMMTAGIILALPSTLLMAPIMFSGNNNPQTRGTASNIGHAALSGTAAVLSIPSLIVTSLGIFVYAAGTFALQDRESLKYKTTLRSLLTAMNDNAEDIIDELCPLEERVVNTLQSIVPELDLCKVTQKQLYDRLTFHAIAKHEKTALTLKVAIDRLPILNQKLYLVCRINRIRQLLENNLMIAFVGIPHAGKSTIIDRLFNIDLHKQDMQHYTTTSHDDKHGDRQEDPTCYRLGKWINNVKDNNITFREWYNRQECNIMQLYTVDFPSIDTCHNDNASSSLGLITRNTAELASIFVVILKAGEVTLADKDIVHLALSNHKPVVVIINQCDKIKSDLKSITNYERIKSQYSRLLEIPESSLLFISALDDNSIAILRSTLFSMIYNLLGNNTKLTNVLPLYFISDLIGNELINNTNVLYTPQDLSEIISSMLFNSLPLTVNSIKNEMKLHEERVHGNNDEVTEQTSLVNGNNKNTTSSSSLSSSIPMKQQILSELRQIACRLHIIEEAFAITTECFLSYYEFVQNRISQEDSLRDILNQRNNNKDDNTLIDSLISLIALSQLNNNLKTYFDSTKQRQQPLIPSEASKGRIVMEVIMSMNSIFIMWIDRGYNTRIILLALRKLGLIKRCESFNDNDLHNAILEIASNGEDIPEAHIVTNTSNSLSDASMEEFAKYQAARLRLDKLSSFVFPTIPKLTLHNADTIRTGSIEEAKATLAQHVLRLRLSLPITITKNPAGHLTPSLIETLMSLDRETLQTSNLRFRLNDDVAIDVDGVTKSLLTKVADEINADPGLVGLYRHEDSSFLYFDTAVCCGSTITSTSKGKYRGLGRLIGLTLKKANSGATLPIHFPLCMYKCLLGDSLTVQDLDSISSSLSHSLHDMCLMDDDIFDSLELTMSGIMSDGKVYEWETNGINHIVQANHRLDFLRGFLQFHLCCNFNEQVLLEELILGVQDVCPRDVFNRLSPLSLQMMLEGSRIIDVNDWKLHTEVKMSGRGGQSTVDLFWQVVEEMSPEDRNQLLCFSTGSAALPSGGFLALSPTFTLVIGTKSIDSLPESHTCFNMLVLPPYQEKKLMKTKLTMAFTMTQVDQFGNA